MMIIYTQNHNYFKNKNDELIHRRTCSLQKVFSFVQSVLTMNKKAGRAYDRRPEIKTLAEAEVLKSMTQKI